MSPFAGKIFLVQNRASIFIPLLIGILGTAMVGHSPHADAIRAVDEVQLLGSGACLGVVIMKVVSQVRKRAN